MQECRSAGRVSSMVSGPACKRGTSSTESTSSWRPNDVIRHRRYNTGLANYGPTIATAGGATYCIMMWRKNTCRPQSSTRPVWVTTYACDLLKSQYHKYAMRSFQKPLLCIYRIPVKVFTGCDWVFVRCWQTWEPVFWSQWACQSNLGDKAAIKPSVPSLQGSITKPRTLNCCCAARACCLLYFPEKVANTAHVCCSSQSWWSLVKKHAQFYMHAHEGAEAVGLMYWCGPTQHRPLYPLLSTSTDSCVTNHSVQAFFITRKY